MWVCGLWRHSASSPDPFAPTGEVWVWLCVSPSGSCAAGLVLSVARLQGVGPLVQGGQIVGALPWGGMLTE